MAEQLQHCRVGGGLQEHCRPPSKLQPPSEATPKAGPRSAAKWAAAAQTRRTLQRPQACCCCCRLQPRLLHHAAAAAALRCCCCCTLLHARVHSPALQHRQVLGHCSQCQTPQRLESVAATKRQALLISFNFWGETLVTVGCLGGRFGSVRQQSLPQFFFQ